MVEDSSNKIVFKKSLAESGTYKLKPEEIGLQKGQEYTWYYSGDLLGRRHRLYLLDLDNWNNEGIAKRIKSLPEITTVDDAIYTSTFLQLASDYYGDLDFYWLSYQVLPQTIDSLSKKQRTQVLNLINRYQSYTR